MRGYLYAASGGWLLEGSVVAATAEELGFTYCLEGRCLRRLRPTGRKNAEPPIDDHPAKELPAAPLQVPLFWPDFLAVPAGSAVAAMTERSPPAPTIDGRSYRGCYAEFYQQF